MAAYYPRKPSTLRDLQDDFNKLDLITYDEDEEYRLEGIQIAKFRGKGAPKKKRVADSTYTGGNARNGLVLTTCSNEEGQKEEVDSIWIYAAALEMIPCMNTSPNLYANSAWSGIALPIFRPMRDGSVVARAEIRGTSFCILQGFIRAHTI